MNKPKKAKTDTKTDTTQGMQKPRNPSDRYVSLGDKTLTWHDDGRVTLRRTDNNELLASWLDRCDDGGYVLSPNRRWLAMAGSPTQLWDLEEGRLRHSIECDGRVEFTPDSARLVTKTISTPQSGMEEEITARTYDLASGSIIDETNWWERQR